MALTPVVPEPATHPALRLAAAAITLRDGRRLAYSELGPRHGLPVLQFHGAIGTPVRPCAETEAVLHAAGVRLVLPQRPGFGDSDPAPGRELTDWPADVAALADALGLHRFAVLGVSAGGPYAAACAAALGPRVAVTTIAAGTVPVRGPGAAPAATPLLRLGARTVRHPRASRVAAGALVRAARARPQTVVGIAERRGGTADRRHLTADRRQAMIDGVLHATRHGSGAVLDDVRLALGPWGFDHRAIDGAVQLWHGAQDATVPLDHALGHARGWAACRTTVLLDEGHFFLRAQLPRILAGITGAWPGRAAHGRPRAAA